MELNKLFGININKNKKDSEPFFKRFELSKFVLQNKQYIMSTDIKIRKGLTLRLKGAPTNTLKTAPTSTQFALKPTDFHGVFPKLVCKEGDAVQAGQPLFYSKYQDSIQFVSPVSGTVK